MPGMPWTDRYRTGHDEIDRQHRVLFDLIDRIREEGEDPFGDGVQVVLDLIKYVIQHFGYEEDLMARLAYPDAGAHRGSHAALSRQVVQLRDAIVAGTIETDTLRTFLDDWLQHHIGENDKKFAAFLAGRS